MRLVTSSPTSRDNLVELMGGVVHPAGMEQADSLDELLICRLDFGRRVIEPCSIVIFGASGDLTSRKLIPALYHLFVDKQLPSPVRIIGFARREKSDEVWRE